MGDQAPPVRFRLSSALAVDTVDGTLSGRSLGSRKARTLLALLAAERGHPVPVDRIVQVLWPEDAPADPPGNVATLVSRTRRLLGPDLLVGVPGAYGLSRDGRWTVDLVEAARLGAEAGNRVTAGEHLLGATAARAALELLGDQPALVDEDDAPWVLEVRREAEELRRTVLHHLIEALTVLDPAEAARAAREASTRDPYDERSVRDLMRALVADGRSTAALAAYESLVRLLREDLGTGPDRASAELQMSILREVDPPGEVAPPRSTRRARLLGREAEVDAIEERWSGVGEPGAASLLVVVGESGIGKTRLLDAAADLASATGGLVCRGRCHPAERSLFLQPYVDALRPTLLRLAPPTLVDLVRGHETAWVSLLPELTTVLGELARTPVDLDRQRREAYDAVTEVLRRLAQTGPVLLTLDDLQDAGAATLDLLGYLAGRLEGVPVLLVVALRREHLSLADVLADRSVRLVLDPLTPPAVEALAADVGLAAHGAHVMARTSGHTLSVVEYLRALGAGSVGVPASLSEAVLTRVRRLAPGTRAVVEAGAVLRRRLDPRLLAALVEATDIATTRRCEELAEVRLFQRSGSIYEFANDLLQECVEAALPPALAEALHRRAADLTADRPELMAEHAHAGGDDARAALGWLRAGEEALRRSAVADARDLVDRSLAVGTASPDTRARALLVRARVQEAEMAWDAAVADIDAALAQTRISGDRHLEMAALRARGGDAAVGAQLQYADVSAPLTAGLELAAGLGDRRAEADFGSRLTILEASQLQLTRAWARAGHTLTRARAAESEDAVLLALDGLKTVCWYLGDVDRLGAVVGEMGPMVRARDDSWLLQWVVFESAFVPAAAGRWDEARALVDEAREHNRHSRFPAYAGFLLAYDGWLARLAGDLDDARRCGHRAVEVTSAVNHPWWYATAAGLLAATLVETGEHAEAQTVARSGLETRSGASLPGRLLCSAALAVVTGDGALTTRVEEALAGIDCPPGRAWVMGADAYTLAARAAARHDAGRAARILQPLLDATVESWRALHQRASAVVPQSRSSTSRAARSAPS